MADDKKKPKIDLKARLGKTAVGLQAPGPSQVPLPLPGPGAGGSAPPGFDSIPGAAPSSSPGRPSSVPMAAPSPRPMGIAPPPGLSPGIPLPPFGQPHRRAADPKPSAAQQTIKVEMGEEVEQERKKMAKRSAIYAVIAAVAGAAIGFVVGGASKTGDLTKRVQDGAARLEKDVKGANDKLKELDAKLMAGAKKLQDKPPTFPDDLATALGGITIPFDASYLDGKGVGNYNGVLQKRVFSYAQAVTDLNQNKDQLKNLLGAAKAPVEKFWKEQADPVASFSVTFRGDNKGMLAELVPNKDPFALAKDWPESYTILKPERSAQGTKSVEKKASRWKKGDLTGNDPVVIPVSADSVAAFTSEKLVFQLTKALLDAIQVTQGNKEDPSHETAGLLKDGDDLVVELHKLAIQK